MESSVRVTINAMTNQFSHKTDLHDSHESETLSRIRLVHQNYGDEKISEKSSNRPELEELLRSSLYLAIVMDRSELEELLRVLLLLKVLTNLSEKKVYYPINANLPPYVLSE